MCEIAPPDIIVKMRYGAGIARPDIPVDVAPIGGAQGAGNVPRTCSPSGV